NGRIGAERFDSEADTVADTSTIEKIVGEMDGVARAAAVATKIYGATQLPRLSQRFPKDRDGGHRVQAQRPRKIFGLGSHVLMHDRRLGHALSLWLACDHAWAMTRIDSSRGWPRVHAASISRPKAARVPAAKDA